MKATEATKKFHLACCQPPAGCELWYEYTSDLMCLDFCRPAHRITPTHLCEVTTPLRHAAWLQALAGHPDQAFARYITNGIVEGFQIGFQRTADLRSAAANMPSARQHPDVVTKYIQEELSRGRILGPFQVSELPPVHINRFGVIPKGHGTGKWHLITDLSSPPGQSVNDGIDPALCTLT